MRVLTEPEATTTTHIASNIHGKVASSSNLKTYDPANESVAKKKALFEAAANAVAAGSNPNINAGGGGVVSSHNSSSSSSSASPSARAAPFLLQRSNSMKISSSSSLDNISGAGSIGNINQMGTSAGGLGASGVGTGTGSYSRIQTLGRHTPLKAKPSSFVDVAGDESETEKGKDEAFQQQRQQVQDGATATTARGVGAFGRSTSFASTESLKSGNKGAVGSTSSVAASGLRSGSGGGSSGNLLKSASARYQLGSIGGNGGEATGLAAGPGFGTSTTAAGSQPRPPHKRSMSTSTTSSGSVGSLHHVNHANHHVPSAANPKTVSPTSSSAVLIGGNHNEEDAGLRGDEDNRTKGTEHSANAQIVADHLVKPSALLASNGGTLPFSVNQNATSTATTGSSASSVGQRQLGVPPITTRAHKKSFSTSDATPSSHSPRSSKDGSAVDPSELGLNQKLAVFETKMNAVAGTSSVSTGPGSPTKQQVSPTKSSGNLASIGSISVKNVSENNRRTSSLKGTNSGADVLGGGGGSGVEDDQSHNDKVPVGSEAAGSPVSDGLLGKAVVAEPGADDDDVKSNSMKGRRGRAPEVPFDDKVNRTPNADRGAGSALGAVVNGAIKSLETTTATMDNSQTRVSEQPDAEMPPKPTVSSKPRSNSHTTATPALAEVSMKSSNSHNTATRTLTEASTKEGNSHAIPTLASAEASMKSNNSDSASGSRRNSNNPAATSGTNNDDSQKVRTGHSRRTSDAKRPPSRNSLPAAPILGQVTPIASGNSSSGPTAQSPSPSVNENSKSAPTRAATLPMPGKLTDSVASDGATSVVKAADVTRDTNKQNGYPSDGSIQAQDASRRESLPKGRSRATEPAVEARITSNNIPPALPKKPKSGATSESLQALTTRPQQTMDDIECRPLKSALPTSSSVSKVPAAKSGAEQDGATSPGILRRQRSLSVSCSMSLGDAPPRKKSSSTATLSKGDDSVGAVTPNGSTVGASAKSKSKTELSPSKSEPPAPSTMTTHPTNQTETPKDTPRAATAKTRDDSVARLARLKEKRRGVVFSNKLRKKETQNEVYRKLWESLPLQPAPRGPPVPPLVTKPCRGKPLRRFEGVVF
ncbi:hypothetical protein HK102_006754 [Quaeritorhiza haematococci]|nr:hypothetical protein HK102_006754 [Quaeritorhiza haematococci]